MCRWQVICMWLEIGQWQSFWRKGDCKSTKNHTLTQVSLSKLSSFSIFAWVRSTSCKIKKESSVTADSLLRQWFSSPKVYKCLWEVGGAELTSASCSTFRIRTRPDSATRITTLIIWCIRHDYKRERKILPSSFAALPSILILQLLKELSKAWTCQRYQLKVTSWEPTENNGDWL